ncbi:lipase [Tripterygium wilfordii]|uniref:Lipase n=1 Tax=Tripterygium wilfordii TaxID=458696 RepID=A0A7J7D2Q2_TRIWF|nr:lipase [Tripterygium wilfordii]
MANRRLREHCGAPKLKNVWLKEISLLYQRTRKSLQAVIILQLEAIGFRISQEKCLDPTKKLNEVKITMALLEWYKKSNHNNVGYYDSYKNRGRRIDREVSMPKRVLTNYWKKKNVEAILSEDSCFWGNVEEATTSCRLLKDLLKNCQETF